MGQRRAADIVREGLEQLILTGKFANGERLDEVRLAQRFEVSRTPLREALQALSASGLIELIPNRGAFVCNPSIRDMIEMFEVMAELEAMCGRLAARRVSEETLQALDEAMAACEAALDEGDSDEYYRRNELFHQLLYAASGNGFLASEAGRVQKRLQPFRRMQLRVRGRMQQSMAEHREILAAIREGDTGRAERALKAHVAVQGEKFNDLLASLAPTKAVDGRKPRRPDLPYPDP